MVVRPGSALGTTCRRALSPGLGSVGVPDLLAEAGGQTAQQLTPADRVQDEDRQGGQHDRGEDGRYVHAVLALEGPQRQREGALSWALGQDQREQEAVPDAQAVVD